MVFLLPLFASGRCLTLCDLGQASAHLRLLFSGTLWRDLLVVEKSLLSDAEQGMAGTGSAGHTRVSRQLLSSTELRLQSLEQ